MKKSVKVMNCGVSYHCQKLTDYNPVCVDSYTV